MCMYDIASVALDESSVGTRTLPCWGVISFPLEHEAAPLPTRPPDLIVGCERLQSIGCEVDQDNQPDRTSTVQIIVPNKRCARTNIEIRFHGAVVCQTLKSVAKVRLIHGRPRLLFVSPWHCLRITKSKRRL